MRDDAEAIHALKAAVCCSCSTVRSFAMGVLFGALLLWLAAVAGLYTAHLVGGAAGINPAVQHPVVAPVVSCPAQVIDVEHLAQVCLDYHNKPVVKKK
jgi:hypothetical protein